MTPRPSAEAAAWKRGLRAAPAWASWVATAPLGLPPAPRCRRSSRRPRAGSRPRAARRTDRAPAGPRTARRPPRTGRPPRQAPGAGLASGAVVFAAEDDHARPGLPGPFRNQRQPLSVDQQHPWPAVVERVGELVLRPPRVQRHGDQSGQLGGPERDLPLRTVAHRDHRPVARAEPVPLAQPARQSGRGGEELTVRTAALPAIRNGWSPNAQVVSTNSRSVLGPSAYTSEPACGPSSSRTTANGPPGPASAACTRVTASTEGGTAGVGSECGTNNLPEHGVGRHARMTQHTDGNPHRPRRRGSPRGVHTRMRACTE